MVSNNQPAVKKPRIFINILLSIILAVFVTIIILTLLLDLYFERIVVGKIYEFEENNLNQASFSIRLMQDLSRSIATQIYQDSLLKKLFYSAVDNPLDVYHILNNLDKYTRLIPYIHSIYIYNPVNATFYISSPVKTEMMQPAAAFFDTEMRAIMDDARHCNSNIPIPRIIHDTLSGKIDYGVYSFIYELSGTRNYKKAGLIIINISEAWIHDIIDSFDTNPAIQSVIIDYNDRLLLDNAEKTMLSHSGLFGYVSQRLKSGKQSGYAIVHKDKQKLFLVYALVKNLNWIFVKSIPYNNIDDEIAVIRMNLVLIAVFILVAGLCLAYGLSRKFYKPIEGILQKVKFLEEKRNDNLFILKQHHLVQWLKVPAALQSTGFAKNPEEIGLQIGSSGQFCLVLIVIDHHKEFQARYTVNEQELLRLGILHKAAHIFTAFRSEEIDLSENHLVLLLNAEPEAADFRSAVEEGIPILQAAILASLNIPVSIVVSPLAEAWEACPLLYAKALHESEQRFILGHQAIILCTDTPTVPPGEFEYSVKKEAEWIDAINRGNIDKMRSAFNELLALAMVFGYKALFVTIYNLAYTINKVISNLNQHSFLNFPFRLSEFLNSINEAEILEEIRSLFDDLFVKLHAGFNRKSSASSAQLLKQILDTIYTGYSDINLSIALLADKYNISPAYLGRIFSKHTGKSLPDFLNEVRINKARELLANNKYTISEIIHLTGFTNNTHFFRMFKKYIGVTPREYRNKRLIS